MPNTMKEGIKKLFLYQTDNMVYQLVRYIIVGGAAFVADFVCLYILVEKFSLNYLISAAIAFCFGLGVNYIFSISWVFNKVGARERWKELIIYLLVGLVGLLANEVIMYSLTDYLDINYLISKIVSVIIIFFWNFFSRKILLSFHS